MTKVNEFHITCDVLESDSITVAMNDKGMTNIFMYIMFNEEPTTKHQLLSRVETLRLIKVLSICMYEDRKDEIKEGVNIADTVSIMSDASRKRAYLYLGIDCIGLNRTTCRKLRDELERGLNA
ncbi:hypothetical protein BPS10C_078 [Bacillus phage BPS10C]|uniref:Uncharacterized protein n=1 Tax=Bacillus phage BPS10C TaxID=1277886 RepID=W5QU96_9CAUD|nr:hypothetical protein BPS10C_078 [Bacillus phage BPS10C]AGI12075.1 hypothetical protein BPS10C_078 [Bacillus phage BPS10C]